MNWLIKFPPKIKQLLTRREPPKDFWMKDPTDGKLVPRKEVENNLFVIPGSNHHLPITPAARFESIFDDKKWEDIPTPKRVHDPLKFRDRIRHTQRVKNAQKQTGNTEAVVLAYGRITGQPVVVAAHDFRFIGGTLGVGTANAVVKGMQEAVRRNVPFIMFATSGGARLQEGIFSLMQLPNTTIAREELREAGLPYIVVLTNPTMGGVTASYAMLGDIHIAEPGAIIGFAGPRVIMKALKLLELPKGFQSAEDLYKHGMLDMIVHRKDMRERLALLCKLLTKPTMAA